MSEANLEALRDEVASKRAMVEQLLEHNPHGIAVLAPDGSIRTNSVGAKTLSMVQVQMAEDQWRDRWGFFAGDRKTRVETANLPVMRAARDGERIDDELLWMFGPGLEQGVLLSVTARPLPGGGGVCVFRDVTEQQRLEHALRERNEALGEREQENRELIARLRVALDELSTPVLDVAEDVLVLPVIGLVDSQRSAQMSERLLSEVVRRKARAVIVDVTGVETIDTATADRFAKLATGVELLGARCLLSGLQPQVAQTLVDLSIDLGHVETHRNLRHALEACLGTNTEAGRRVVRRIARREA